MNIEEEDIPEESVILRATKGMGNGKLNHITDLIYVDETAFDRSKTEEIAEEVNK